MKRIAKKISPKIRRVIESEAEIETAKAEAVRDAEVAVEDGDDMGDTEVAVEDSDGDSEAAAEAEAPKLPNKKAEFMHEDLITVAVPDGYEFGTHRPLSRIEFDRTATFYFHRAASEKWKSEQLLAKSEKLFQKAEMIHALGDDKTAAAVKKAERLVKSLAMLEEQLLADGIDPAILAAIKASGQGS